MTKGHNQSHHKQSGNPPKNAMVKGENRHLTDQKQNKSPDQGRSRDKDPSEGTKGKNGI